MESVNLDSTYIYLSCCKSQILPTIDFRVCCLKLVVDDKVTQLYYISNCLYKEGVGLDANTPSDNVVKVLIIGSDGTIRTYTSDEKEILRAISANFGCFGVIFDMTMKLIPEVIVKVENRYMNLDDLFFNAEKIQQVFEENWSVEVLWFPNTSLSLFDYNPKNYEVLLRVINKETKKVETAKQTYYDWKEMKDYLSAEALLLISPILTGNPSLTPLYALSSFGAFKNII